METGEPMITLERRIEALLNQLADFDARIRHLEERQQAIENWCRKLYDAVAPMYDDFHRKSRKQEDSETTGGNRQQGEIEKTG